jgi:hypothetical protein
MRLLLLISVLAASDCKDRSSIDSLKISCSSKKGIINKFWLNTVPVWSCQDMVSDLQLHTFNGNPIEVGNLCDYKELTRLEAISCASVGGILQSVKYKFLI